MRGAKGDARTFIIVIFALVFLGMALVTVVYVGIPFLKYGSINVCWGTFTGQLGKFKVGTFYMDDYNAVDVNFGNEGGGCVLRLWFINKETLEEIEGLAEQIEDEILKDYKREVSIRDKIVSQCDKENKENKGFIVASPWFGDGPEVGGALTWVTIGAVAGGILLPGHGGALGKLKIKGIPLVRSFNAIISGLGAKEAHDLAKGFFEAMEEWGKSAFCLPLKMGFHEEKFIPEKGITEEGDIESPGGRYCIILYKGRDSYYVASFENSCNHNEENIQKSVEEFRNMEKQTG